MLPGHFAIFLLALMLVSTTPVGTGAGVHEFDLLHPIFGHVHLVNGRAVSHESQTPAARPSPTPVIAGGSPSDVEDAGIGLSPTIPWLPLSLPSLRPLSRLLNDAPSPTNRTEAPPDPPPVC